jgi:hypothetical protein
MRNGLFSLLMSGVFANTAFSAMMLATLELPLGSILYSGLEEVLLVFNGIP